MSTPKQVLLLIVLGAALLLASVCIWNGANVLDMRAWDDYFVGRKAETELNRFYANIRLGMTETEVMDAFEQIVNGRNTWDLIEEPSHIIIVTPVKWNARNWKCYLDFVDGELSSVRVRVVDNEAIPANAPRDMEKVPAVQ